MSLFNSTFNSNMTTNLQNCIHGSNVLKFCKRTKRNLLTLSSTYWQLYLLQVQPLGLNYLTIATSENACSNSKAYVSRGGINDDIDA